MVESLIDKTKINIDKYGFYFWFILFGFFDIIFSVIHNPKFIPLGLIFCAFGMAGSIISDLLDKISSKCFEKVKEIDGKNITQVVPPIWFHLLIFVIKISLLYFLFLFIDFKYSFFVWP